MSTQRTHRARRRPIIGAALAGLMLAVAAAPAGAAVKPDPKPWDIRISPIWEANTSPKAQQVARLDPTKAPQGANDWNCKPSAAHPEPVILIHGTWGNAYGSWNGLAPILKDQGYCVFATNYGNSTGIKGINGTADMVAAAQELNAFVTQVRTATKAKSVALIGHSQGGAQARYVANLLAPAGTVSKVIMISPTNHATSLSGLATLRNLLGLNTLVDMVLGDWLAMPGAVQQSYNSSPFYVNLNGQGETVPGIDYTVIATRNDEVATPYTIAFITAGAGATVENITIQDLCSLDQSEHMSMQYSKNVAQIVLNKLDPAHPHALRCYVQAPLVGSTNALGIG